MIEQPAHPTEKYIEGRLAFYESGIDFYARHGQTQLAKWSSDEAEKWRQKLKPTVRASGDGE
jgi:hypothetical protein